MTTSAPTSRSRVQLTLFAEASPARTSAKPAGKPVSRSALGQVSFTNSCVSFAWWDRDSSSWRTSQRSFLEGWTSFSENWPKQGLMRNGHVFRQVLWAPATAGTAGGLLPMPVATDRLGARNATATRKPGSQHHSGVTLTDWLWMTYGDVGLLTPTANDWKGPTNWEKAQRHGPQRLPDLLPTGERFYLNPAFVEEMMGFAVGWTV